MKKIIALLAVIAMLFAFAGCTADQNKDNASDASQAKKPTVVVGYTIYKPMNYLDDAGTLIGFDTELAEAVFEGLGYKVVFKEIKWENKYTELESGAINCVWNGFTCNTADDDGVARADKVDFSYNYMENRQVVVVKKDSGIAAKKDLGGKSADAENGSAGETYAKGLADNIVFKGAPKQTDCLMSVKSGNADFAVLDAQLAKSYCGKGDYAELQIVDALSSDVEYYAIGFKKGSELNAKVHEQLEELAKDGTITDLAKKYGLETTAITDFADQK